MTRLDEAMLQCCSAAVSRPSAVQFMMKLCNNSTSMSNVVGTIQSIQNFVKSVNIYQNR